LTQGGINVEVVEDVVVGGGGLGCGSYASSGAGGCVVGVFVFAAVWFFEFGASVVECVVV